MACIRNMIQLLFMHSVWYRLRMVKICNVSTKKLLDPSASSFYRQVNCFIVILLISHDVL